MRANDASRDATHAAQHEPLTASLLTELPRPLRDTLFADALRVELPAGSIFYRDDDAPRCALVVAGLIRVVLSAPDGRSVVVRYARAGELLGVPTIIGGPASVSAQLVTDATLLLLNGQTLRRLGQSEPALAWLLAREVTRRLYDTLDAFGGATFASLRQRVARQLLDLATRQPDGQLVAALTQQALAEAVGSARPAVARVIAELRELGLVATAPHGVAILDAHGLHAETWSRGL